MGIKFFYVVLMPLVFINYHLTYTLISQYKKSYKGICLLLLNCILTLFIFLLVLNINGDDSFCSTYICVYIY